MAEIPSYLAPNAVPAAPQAPAAAPSTDLSSGGPSENVFDVQNKTPLDIPHSDFEIAVRSGQYAPQAKKEYVVKDSSGQMHSVLGTNLKSVFDEGSTFASPEESHAHIVNTKYGNSPVLAGFEAAERGFLPGISDRMLTGSKTLNGNIITREDLAGRAEANPISSMIGEAIGTTAAVFSPAGKATVGASTAAVTKGLAKLGAKAGLSNKVAQAIVSKIIPVAAGSAVEGAYFGAAHLLNEDALGTAQFNAENLLSSVEQGALWGAALGGSLSAMGSASSSTATAIAESNAGKYLGGKLSHLSDSIGNKTKAAREFLGLSPSKARKLAERDAGFMDDAIKFTQEALEENPRATIVEVAQKAKSDINAVGDRIGSVYQKVDEAAASSGKVNTISNSDLKTKIASTIEEKLLPKLDGVEGASVERKLLNDAISEIADSAPLAKGNASAQEMHQQMRNLDEMIFTEEGTLKAKTLKSKMFRIQRDVIREELNTATKLAEKNHPELAGLFDDLKGSNRRFSTLKQLEKSVAAASDTSINGGGPKIDSFFSLGKAILDSDTLRKMKILGKIEGYQQKTSSAIATSFKEISKGVKSTEPLVSQMLVSSQLSAKMEDGKKIKARDEQEAYRNIAANAKFASENPEQFLKGVNRYTGHLYGVAPKTSGALDTAALNTMVFLHSKATTNMKKTGFFDANKQSKASGQDMLKMQQRMDIIQNPSKAIKLLGKGKLGATHVETLKAVYPEMHAKMQEHAMNFLSSDAAKALTYSTKLNMAVLLGVQAHESTAAANVLGLQANFESSEDNQGGVINSTQGGLAKVNKASRMNTDESDDI